MQHFPVDTFSATREERAGEVGGYVDGCYQVKGIEWGVFNPGKLAQEPAFLNAAKV